MATESPTCTDEEVNEARKHVVVCGGGIIGVCTAYYLGRKGADVTLVEKSSVACGASCKACGLLSPDQYKSTRLSDLTRTSFRLHQELSLRLDGAHTYGYQPVDLLRLYLYLFPFDEPPTSTITPSTSPLLPSWIDGPTFRSPKVLSSNETTAHIHPQLFTETLLSTAKKEYGLKLIIGEVHHVDVNDGKAIGVSYLDQQDGHKYIAADAVVLALGPWSNRDPLISSLYNVFSYKTHSIILRPKKPIATTLQVFYPMYREPPGAKVLVPSEYPIIEVSARVYARATGEVYIAGSSEVCEVPDDPKKIAVDPTIIRMLHMIAGIVSSRLRYGEAEVLAEQASVMSCTDDGFPIIGNISGVEKCFVATGNRSFGLLVGPATGLCLAELVLDDHSETVNVTQFSPSRFGPWDATELVRKFQVMFNSSNEIK